jgi:hypothetical protein
MLWPYEMRGASLWSSPSLLQRDNGKALLLYPAHDGRLYAFTEGGMDQPPVDAPQNATLTGWSPDSRQGHTERAPVSHFAKTVPPMVGLALVLAGAVVVFLPRRDTPAA